VVPLSPDFDPFPLRKGRITEHTSAISGKYREISTIAERSSVIVGYESHFRLKVVDQVEVGPLKRSVAQNAVFTHRTGWRNFAAFVPTFRRISQPPNSNMAFGPETRSRATSNI
jgi:hypothetical protein